MNVQNDATAATELVSRAILPSLLIDYGDLPAAVKAILKLLKNSGQIYDMGGIPVQVLAPPREPVKITPLTHHAVTMQTHELCRPVTLHKGEEKPITFPERAAKMLVDAADGFPKLNGAASTPILRDDGTMRAASGYDAETGLWCQNVPTLRIPAKPSWADAEAALRTLRAQFQTFPFADSLRYTKYDLDVVDTDQPPGEAESAFLCGLLTAICRPSLWLAPGLLITAPDVSGAGSGKGLLVQGICAIAFGAPPCAFTAGSEKAELDKRIASELMQAGHALFLDNANGMALKSDTLASVITERPARVRIFGQTKMAALNSTAFIAITGNGLSVSEDLARRFLACELDPKCDDPESRDLPGRDVFLAEVRSRRAELLTAALTIWRWGRQNEAGLMRGKSFGSFETWAKWVRDPLLTLGCRDPVAQISKAKALDPRRVRLAELFETWHFNHRDEPMKVEDLADAVKAIADPQNRGRQYRAAWFSKMHNTRAAGYVLTRQQAAGTWTGATYQLTPIAQTKET